MSSCSWTSGDCARSCSILPVVGALTRRAVAERGVGRCYVQTQEDNVAARTLYARCGFTDSHRYHYRMGPAPTAG